ncbi:MAG: phosphomannomutase/phosphoglucomutase [Candidatus Doudnabacteria bacterium]|nr:phosphomannomutase/phosphoglucomutase [Candidatus Doudnabacteria bacterium]
MAKLNHLMFREYDIRGRESEEELNVKSISLIAKAYGTFLRKNNITGSVVGHDNRKTSEDFYQVCLDALRSTGVDAIGLGTCLTPMIYWAPYYFKVEGGLMVTASHNPAGWNGLKLGMGYSYTLSSAEIQQVRQFAEAENFTKGAGRFHEENIKQAYFSDLLSRAKLHRKIKILLNTANATSSMFSPELFRQFGCEVIEYNTKLDPAYPNYVPNPANVAMMEDTGRQVIKHRADVGIGIDADGDRLGVTDEQGQTIWPDRWLILLARLTLARKPGAKIVFDVKVSEALPEDITAHGGVPIMCPTGYMYVKEKLKSEGGSFGGEQSGHAFFVDEYYGFDDANFAALKLLEYLSQQDKPLSQVIAQTPYYVSTPAYHAHVSDEGVKYSIVDKLTQEFKTEGYKVVDINGARVYMKSGWGLVRASSNLPALVLRFEAKTKEDLTVIENVFRKKLSKFPAVSPEWESA